MARKAPPREVQAIETADDLDRRAARLVECLLDDGVLEPVNSRARVSLARKLADLLQALPDDPDAKTAGRAAEAALDLLVEAPEVAEVFADEAQVAVLLKTIWAKGS